MRFNIVMVVCISFCMAAGTVLAETEPICCTWVNTAYNSVNSLQKLIINYDGSFQGYATQAATDSIGKGTFRIVRKWKDTDQNVWYHVRWDSLTDNQRCLKLVKVSANGATMESVFALKEFPKDIDPSSPNYQTYTRAGNF